MGKVTLKYNVLVPCTAAIPVRVATSGMYSPGCAMKSGAVNRPKATCPIASGNRLMPVQFTAVGDSGPPTAISRLKVMEAIDPKGNTARLSPAPMLKSTFVGLVPFRTWSRTFSIRYVALCVENRLTAAMSRFDTDAWRAAHSAVRSARRYQRRPGSEAPARSKRYRWNASLASMARPEMSRMPLVTTSAYRECSTSGSSAVACSVYVSGSHTTWLMPTVRPM